MLIAILVMSILIVINTFLVFVMLAAIYGKCNDLIELKVKTLDAVIEALKDFVKGLNKNDTHKTI